MNTAYMVLMVEYERGWGSRPDGYLVFANEDSAKAYIIKQNEGRSMLDVPDYYIQYELIGEAPCSLDFQLALVASELGFLAVDDKAEMLWSKERRATKYRI